ncbi:DUF4190 domain-containing protein [Actinomadura kijaniata]|uniref:DUF4190 domain-containing protein n=1 Tax=Actinomadura kijaniata TaxID=46161 RepID=UPI003F197913
MSHGWSGNPYDVYNDPDGPYYDPHYYGPPARPAPGSAVAALVCSSVVTFACCNVLALPAIITSAMAVSRSARDPRGARTLTVWSWVLFGGAMAVAVAYLALMVAFDF